MERIAAVLSVLIIAGCSIARSGDAPQYSATVVRNCGYTDGGGYDLSIDMGGQDITVHVDGPPDGNEWRLGSALRILVCDRHLDQCTSPTQGSVRMLRQSSDRFDGIISFELPGHSESIQFHGIIQNPKELKVCG